MVIVKKHTKQFKFEFLLYIHNSDLMKDIFKVVAKAKAKKRCLMIGELGICVYQTHFANMWSRLL